MRSVHPVRSALSLASVARGDEEGVRLLDPGALHWGQARAAVGGSRQVILHAAPVALVDVLRAVPETLLDLEDEALRPLADAAIHPVASARRQLDSKQPEVGTGGECTFESVPRHRSRVDLQALRVG